MLCLSHEGWSVNSAIERMGKKLVKSSTLPTSAMHPSAVSCLPAAVAGANPAGPSDSTGESSQYLPIAVYITEGTPHASTLIAGPTCNTKLLKKN